MTMPMYVCMYVYVRKLGGGGGGGGSLALFDGFDGFRSGAQKYRSIGGGMCIFFQKPLQMAWICRWFQVSTQRYVREMGPRLCLLRVFSLWYQRCTILLCTLPHFAFSLLPISFAHCVVTTTMSKRTATGPSTHPKRERVAMGVNLRTISESMSVAEIANDFDSLETGISALSSPGIPHLDSRHLRALEFVFLKVARSNPELAQASNLSDMSDDSCFA